MTAIALGATPACAVRRIVPLATRCRDDAQRWAQLLVRLDVAGVDAGEKREVSR